MSESKHGIGGSDLEEQLLLPSETKQALIEEVTDLKVEPVGTGAQPRKRGRPKKTSGSTATAAVPSLPQKRPRGRPPGTKLVPSSSR